MTACGERYFQVGYIHVPVSKYETPSSGQLVSTQRLLSFKTLAMYLQQVSVLLLACVSLCTSRSVPTNLHQRRSATIAVDTASPLKAGVPLEAFVSFSIEFSSFPDFAGNASHPNTFSNNLLNNLGNLTGTKPYIRVGGNTQDYAYAHISTVSTKHAALTSLSSAYSIALFSI